jgi:branched-chain amino acid transport system ATP-binding protein
MSLLKVEYLEARHGLLQAVRGVSFEVGAGETLALVGANGAGKTTLLRAIAGAHQPTAGRILFDGIDVTAVPTYARLRAGIALVPEGRRLFAGMTVKENLMVAGAHGRRGAWDIDAVVEAFPLLRAKLKRRAGNLSGGEQQAAAIGRALMTNPRLLLLDEVSLGLAPIAVEAVYLSLSCLIAAGTTIVLVEQDISLALGIAKSLVCMLEGRITLQGSAKDLSREQITEAYFGLNRSRQATR